MNVPGVTETGVEGAGNFSRGDREGASDGSGARGPGGVPPRTGGRSGSTASERVGLGDGGGDGGVFPFSLSTAEGGEGEREFPFSPPPGSGGF